MGNQQNIVNIFPLWCQFAAILLLFFEPLKYYDDNYYWDWMKPNNRRRQNWKSRIFSKTSEFNLIETKQMETFKSPIFSFLEQQIQAKAEEFTINLRKHIMTKSIKPWAVAQND